MTKNLEGICGCWPVRNRDESAKGHTAKEADTCAAFEILKLKWICFSGTEKLLKAKQSHSLLVHAALFPMHDHTTLKYRNWPEAWTLYRLYAKDY